MTFYLSENAKPGDPNPAPAPNANFGDVLGAAWDATDLQEDGWLQVARVRREIFDEIDAAIGDFEADTPVDSPLDTLKEGVPAPYRGYFETDEARRPYVERQKLARAGRFAARNPAGYGGLPLTEDQLTAEIDRRMADALREEQAVMAAGGFGSGVATWLGSTARSSVSEGSLVSMAVGGPEFRLGLAGAARFMGIEGALGAGGAALVLPEQSIQAERLGIPPPEALHEITMGFVTGAGVAGIGAAAFRGFTYLTGRARGEAELRPAGADPYDAQAAVDAAEAALREGRPAPLSQIGPGVDQRARDALGRLEDVAGPLTIISDVRTPEENAAAGGARGSQHLHGRAFDVDVAGLSIPERQELIRRARAAGFSGIGVYENSLHFDVGGDRAWGPSYRRDSLPDWAAEAIGAPVGRFAQGAIDAGDFDAVAGRIIGAESGGRSDARNPNSSATGAGQFLDATWLELVGRTRPDLIEGRSQAEVLAMRGDRALAREMVAAYARENAALLSAEGLPTDPGSLYLAHFLGPGGAAQALRADPGAHVSAVMTPEQLRANAAVRYGGKSLAEFTVGDLRRWAEVKVGTAVDPGTAWRPAGPHGYTRAGQVTTPAGTRLDVEYEIVDASTLLPASGALQPRDRSRAASDEQIAEIAARLDPARLMPSPETDRGAPLVGPDNVIESGNGRVRSILRAAEMHPDRYEAYRAAIAQVAPIPEGVTTPVLIARRTTELDDAARVRTVQESNTSSIARMSATEQAGMDGSAIATADLELIDPRVPLSNPANQTAARSLLARLPQTERAGLVDAEGQLNAAGVRRLREALFARAYGAEDLTRVLAEDEGGDLRGLLEALGDAAPRWALLRDEVAAGNLQPELDATEALTEALRMIAAARATARATPGLSVRAALEERLAQVDAFTGPVDEVTRRFVDVYYRPGGPRSQADVAALLNRYVDEAFRVGDTQQRLFAETAAATPEEVLDAIRAEDPDALGGARAVAGDAEGGRSAERPEPDDREPGPRGSGDPVGSGTEGPFGPVLTEYAGDPEGAIARLMTDKTGEAAAVVDRPDLGPIALVYGDRKKGLAHIAHKHSEMLVRVPDLLRDGRLIADKAGLPRAYLADGADPANVAVIRLDYDQAEKTWLVTAFEDEQGSVVARQARTSNEQPASASSRIPDATGQTENTPSAAAVQGPDIRLADDAEFGGGSASPLVDQANRRLIEDLRAQLEAEGDFEVATGALIDGTNGKVAEAVSARALLDDLEDRQDLAEVISACTLGGRSTTGGAGDA